MKLTDEQIDIINAVRNGKNVYVDACIGSGKTTLLNSLSKKLLSKRILYLTYNKLLKEDAKKTITLGNVEVHNYHGFVYKYLSIHKLKYSHQSGISDFITHIKNGEVLMPQYDIILIDEYQDINESIRDLLLTIKDCQNKIVQWVFVGDMAQKIYDTTTLDVLNDCVYQIIDDFETFPLTACFRLNADYANRIGKIWGKEIVGVNEDMSVEDIPYDPYVLSDILNEYPNKDILILSPYRNNVAVSDFINHLESKFPDKYNKRNLYVTINDKDNNNSPVANSMIVTTYDGSKGLEKPLLVLFGYNTNILEKRSAQGDREIIKNLFLVAASRGKSRIIRISDTYPLLDESNFESSLAFRVPETDFMISQMFDFKYDTDIDACYDYLDIEKIDKEDVSEIKALHTDENILLSPAIGIYQEAIFFSDWNFEKALRFYNKESPIVKYVLKTKPSTLYKQILGLVAIETNLIRYVAQTVDEFMSEYDYRKLSHRLLEDLDPDVESQIPVSYSDTNVRIKGNIDTVHNGVPFELKFVQELEKKHFLQLASYMLFGEYEYGILWNTRFNMQYRVRIKNKDKFLKQVIKTIRKIK